MSDEVRIPFGDKPNETATLLLAAADELDGFEQEQVRTGLGVFYAPQEVADKAGFGEKKAEKKEPEKKPAKKAAKKSSSRR